MIFIYILIVKEIVFTCEIYAATVYQQSDILFLIFHDLIPTVILEGLYPHGFKCLVR